MKWLSFLLLAAWLAPAWATTYYFVGGVYNVRTQHTTCGAGTCEILPVGGRVTGSFTTAAPLAANQAQANIAPLVTSFSFSDGTNTYASGDANVRVRRFAVATDAAGVPTNPDVELQRWQAAAPHDAGNNRLDYLQIHAISGAVDNAACDTFGASPDTGVADSCLGVGPTSTDTSNGFSQFAMAWSVDVPIVVPAPVATTYYVAGGVYSLRIPNSTCATGSCAAFPLGGRVAGTFTTVVPIPPNLPDTEVSGLVASFAFSDGATAYASGDANARLRTWSVQTDASGVPGPFAVMLQRWQSAAPHAVGSRVDVAVLIGGEALAYRNASCDLVASVGDTCADPQQTTDTSFGASELPTRISVGTPLSLVPVPATYAFTSGNYVTIINHTTCAAGACANYTPAMRVTGSFTTVDTIPPGADVDFLGGLVSAYSFSDGLQTYASGDPLTRLVLAALQTGPSGEPVSVVMIIERWQSPAPHPAGSRLGVLEVELAEASAAYNLTCLADAAQSPVTGEMDTCLSFDSSTDTSAAFATGGQWRVVSAGAGLATPVPIGAPAMLAFLVLALAGCAASALGARKGR